MNHSRKRNKGKYVFFGIVLFAIIIVIIALSFRIHRKTLLPKDDAFDLPNSEYTRYGDLIYFVFHDYSYALLPYDSRYQVWTERETESLGLYQHGQYRIFGYASDSKRYFLYSDACDMSRPYPGTYYRSDFIFPNLTANAILKITFCRLEEVQDSTGLRNKTEYEEISLHEAAQIESVLTYLTQMGFDDSLNYYNNDGELEENVLCAYVYFNDVPFLRYRLGYISRNTAALFC